MLSGLVVSLSLRIIVTGLIAQYPLGGVSWDYVQYVLGIAKLGHDVYYIEDTGQWPYNPSEGGVAKGCEYNVRYLDKVMSKFNLGNKWAYRFPWQSKWFGLSDKERKEAIRSADILINVSGSLAQPEDYRQIPVMVYIDSDPVFTQIKLKRGQNDFAKIVDLHDVHFSFGEALSNDLKTTGQDWLPTRQPIVLSEWCPTVIRREVFTTVMNWTSYKPIEYQGRLYGQKDIEFKRFVDLPQHLPKTYLEIAVHTGKTRRTPRELLKTRGWHVVHPDDVCPDIDSYRHYIQSSKAEWSVAKNGYVVGNSGWFSCRSACYLAAGRPVVVQNTGFQDILPCGEGILSFSNVQEAVDAVQKVQSQYNKHANAAQGIAEEYFDSAKVISKLLEDATKSGG